MVKGYQPTCTKTGLTDGKTCSVCGEEIEKQETIPVLPHTEKIVKGYEATCAKTGLTDGKTCLVCGEEIEKQEVIPLMSSHTEEIVKGYDSTCTKEGLTDGIACSVCSVVIEEQRKIDPKGHKETLYQMFAPSCTEEGFDLYVCSVCGETEKRNILSSLGHLWVEGDDGTYYFCEICDEIVDKESLFS